MKKVIIYILSSILALSTFIMYIGYKLHDTRTTTQSEYYMILQVAESCRYLCIFAKQNLSINPTSQCLSDPDKITGKYWIYPEWACDIVNNPKTPEDELIENKCIEYVYGYAKNLIEIDKDCNVVNIIYKGKNISLMI